MKSDLWCYNVFNNIKVGAPMKLVTQTEVLSARFGDETAVKMLCETGFDGLDYSMFVMQDDDNILNSSGYKNHIKNVRALADSYGVTFEQAHAPFPSAKEFDAEYSEKIFGKLVCALEIAGMLDAKICVVHPVAFSKDQKARNIELYQKLEPYARDFGIKIALENMWGWSDELNRIVPNVCSVASEFNDYFDSLNSAAFTCCLDLGHCGLVGETAGGMIREMGSRIGALHIHDNDNYHDSHTLPYLSAMDWDDILRALGEIDYKGHFTYEADYFLKKFPDDLLPACIKFMHDVGRSMINKIEGYRIKNV